jgi:DNA-binding transcriptional regulator of glucitol operon
VPFSNTTAVLILGLAIAWVLQLFLSYWQMRKFYGRVSFLRKQYGGTASIGLEGTAWKRRQYAVLVVDDEKRILAAEQLSGWTIFASLKPVEGLKGVTLAELCDDKVILPISNNKKLLLAFRNAAMHIETAQEKAKAREQEEGVNENAPADSSTSL